MIIYLFLLLTIVPLVEIYLLGILVDHLNWGPTIVLVVATGVLGTWLARREGLRALAQIQNDMRAGASPAGAVMEGVLILMAGVVLITPGILTDIVGFLLLVPPIRRLVGRVISSSIARHVKVVGHHGRPPFDQDEFIDVEARSGNSGQPASSPSRLE